MRKVDILAVKAPAKINLYLGVHTDRDERGYHCVDSVMAALDFGDVVTLTPAEGLSVTCEPGIRAHMDHTTTYRAVEALGKAFGHDPAFAVHIERHIPERSGMGGSSTDAGAALRVACQLWGIDPEDSRVVDIARSIVFELPPYFANIRKRLIKTPKIYFYDTGLLCHLLGIRTLEQLRTSEYRGAIFENYVIAETVKRHYNAGRTPEMYFYRDTTGKEVDLIDLTDGAEIVEIKAGMTFKSEFSKLVQEVHGLLNLPNCYCCIVMQREDEITVDGVKVVPVRQWVMREDVPIA